MTMRRLVPAAEIHIEQRVANSRFVAYASYVRSSEEAWDFLTRVRSAHPQATHAVPAFRIGHGAAVTEHCSDAGEPSGTAGRPILTVLHGSGIGDVIVVVVRYFGGTKLGTGGLVRAYTSAAQAVLKDLPLAELRATEVLHFHCPYEFYKRIVNEIDQLAGQRLSEDFGAEVSITVGLAAQSAEVFKSAMRELTRGRMDIEVLETEANTLFPAGTLSRIALTSGGMKR